MNASELQWIPVVRDQVSDVLQRAEGKTLPPMESVDVRSRRRQGASGDYIGTLPITNVAMRDLIR